jgi:hypothetical protein
MINKTRGAPRDGDLLLHGIAWCGHCGHKMYVRYKNGGEYVCNHLRTHHALPTCQHVRAERVDEAVHQAFLAVGASRNRGSMECAPRKSSKPTKHCSIVLSVSLSASVMKQLWLSANTAGLTLIIGLSLANSNGAGRPPCVPYEMRKTPLSSHWRSEAPVRAAISFAASQF